MVTPMRNTTRWPLPTNYVTPAPTPTAMSSRGESHEQNSIAASAFGFPKSQKIHMRPPPGSTCALSADNNRQAIADPENPKTFYVCLPMHEQNAAVYGKLQNSTANSQTDATNNSEGHWVKMQCPANERFDPYEKNCNSKLNTASYSGYKLETHQTEQIEK